MHAGLLEQRVEPRRVPALRQPEAAVPVPEALAVRGDAGADLEPRAGGGGQQRQHGVGGRRGPAHVRGERADEVAPARLEALGRARVQIRRALELARHPRVLGRRDVAPVRLRPDLAQEGEEALGHAAGLELVAQHRGQRERDPPGVGVEHVEQRQVGGRHRLPQPLLAERPRPEALHVGHVGVQDDAEAAAHGRRTARKSSARSRSADRSAKSRTEMAGVKRS